jgi:tetratricopeptide (TPR) repeat protein
MLRNLVGERPELLPDLTLGVIDTYSGLPALLIKMGNLEEAENTRREGMAYLRKAAETLALQTQPQSADFLWVRGQLLARLGRWQQAASDLTRARDLRPGEGRFWHGSAAVLIQKGDLEAYSEHRRRSLEQFASTRDADTAEPIAKDCLIVPVPEDQLSKAAKLADDAFVLAKNNGRLTWYECCKGLAEYRLGHFANAAEWMQKVLSRSGDPKAPIPAARGTGDSMARDVEAWAVLAMAQQRLKQDEGARVSLAKGVDLAREKLPRVGTEDLGTEWVDWIIAQALLHEASGLIVPEKSLNPDPKAQQ